MDSNDILAKVQKIHFVGIGGSGMCPIAEILHHKELSSHGFRHQRIRHFTTDSFLWHSRVYGASSRKHWRCRIGCLHGGGESR